MQSSLSHRFGSLGSLSFSLPIALTVMVLGACSSSDDASAILEVSGPPADVPVGGDFSVEVRLLDAEGTLLASNTSTVTASISENPTGGTLVGTTAVQASGGVATFSQLAIDTPGSGYRLRFSAGGFQNGTSSPFNVFGAPAALQFTTQPGNATAYQQLATPVGVRVVDAGGNTVHDAAVEVTIGFENNAGELILHASGINDPNPGTEPRLFELIDPAIPAKLQWLPNNTGLNEVLEVVHNPSTGELHAIIRSDNNFYTGDPATGVMELVGEGTLDEVKGAAFESGSMARLLAVVSQNSSFGQDELLEIDPADGTLSQIGLLTIDQGTLDGFTGFAHDTSDDTFFGVTRLGGLGLTGRAFVQVFPNTLTATFIGDTGDSVAGLAIGGDGTIYAVTGDGATVPSTLFTVDETTGALTLLLPLETAEDGEAIGMVPAQLRGTTSAQSVEGVASFPGLQVNAVGSGYTLRASATGLESAVSAPFDITAATPGGTLMFSAASQTVSEIDGTVSIDLEIDAAQAHDIVVTMSIGGSVSGAQTGTPDIDFDTTFLFQITIPAGQTTASGTIGLIDDADAEGDESMILFIENASLAGAIGAIDTQTVTLSSDE